MASEYNTQYVDGLLEHFREEMASIAAEVVKPRDKFQVQLGTERRLVHIPASTHDKADEDTERWKGAYATAKQVNGVAQFEWMEREKVEAVRNRIPPTARAGRLSRR